MGEPSTPVADKPNNSHSTGEDTATPLKNIETNSSSGKQVCSNRFSESSPSYANRAAQLKSKNSNEHSGV